MAEVPFGEWLKRRRKASGMTQEQLAEQVNCSAITLRKIEAEERRPSAQIVERLAETFSIPKDDQTRFLRFARGDWRSAPAEPDEDAPWSASKPSSRFRVPARLNRLIGREQDAARVQEYLATTGTRLVNLTGPPGIGKTSLSQQVAADSLGVFEDGIFFIELTPLHDPGLVASAIAQVLRLTEAGHRSVMELLKDYIAEKHLLLVLDNFEHLLDAAPIVPELLTACPHLKLLATSREALRVPGEWVYPVPPLRFPEGFESGSMDAQSALGYSALSLFAERARAVQPGFAIDAQNLEAVAAICRRLDGLPLAIELIAAHIRFMSPQALSARLSDSFVLSADGRRAVPARQRTLNDAIAWSYKLLDPGEQRLFAHLGIFAGRFTFEASVEITGNANAKEGIQAFCDKSLLQRTLDERGESRFTMLFSIREFALKRLDEMHETANARDRHLDFFVRFAERAESEFFNSAQMDWHSRMAAELDNLRNAIEWSTMAGAAEGVEGEHPRLEAGLRLAGALYWLWDDRDFPNETSRWVKDVISKSRQPTPYRARALLSLGVLHATLNNFTEARPCFEEALAICGNLDNPLLLAMSLTYRGAIDEAQANYISAQSYLEQGLAIAEGLKIIPLIGWNSSLLADTVLMQGDHARAKELYQKSTGLFKDIRQRDLLAYPLRRLGDLALSEEKLAEASQRFRESLEMNHAVGFQYGIIASLAAFARLAQAQKKMERAAQLYGALGKRFKKTSWRLYLVDEVEYERGLANLRGLLNDKTLVEAWAKGEEMTIQEAVAFALGE